MREGAGVGVGALIVCDGFVTPDAYVDVRPVTTKAAAMIARTMIGRTKRIIRLRMIVFLSI